MARSAEVGGEVDDPMFQDVLDLLMNDVWEDSHGPVPLHFRPHQLVGLADAAPADGGGAAQPAKGTKAALSMPQVAEPMAVASSDSALPDNAHSEVHSGNLPPLDNLPPSVGSHLAGRAWRRAAAAEAVEPAVPVLGRLLLNELDKLSMTALYSIVLAYLPAQPQKHSSPWSLSRMMARYTVRSVPTGDALRLTMMDTADLIGEVCRLASNQAQEAVADLEGSLGSVPDLAQSAREPAPMMDPLVGMVQLGMSAWAAKTIAKEALPFREDQGLGKWCPDLVMLEVLGLSGGDQRLATLVDVSSRKLYRDLMLRVTAELETLTVYANMALALDYLQDVESNTWDKPTMVRRLSLLAVSMVMPEQARELLFLGGQPFFDLLCSLLAGAGREEQSPAKLLWKLSVRGLASLEAQLELDVPDSTDRHVRVAKILAAAAGKEAKRRVLAEKLKPDVPAASLRSSCPKILKLEVAARPRKRQRPFSGK
eukprot:CAMPEP_0176267986 /NCGR_PEP_ID=MMETSP0121_2-20121125/43440_1 /TAXON_ID=160619 /ORGANISM="Kryptoperidinium foliaceum, Strain CCMP 1326" /LENGTH=481 /DNA_ID=CAMNT_0017608063 /DNA_START=29 /DNA_END=1474 /DNA_ORIENTATION=+